MGRADKELRKKAIKLPVSIHLGKNGLEKSQVEELKKQLKKKKLIKVKMLKSFVEGKTGKSRKTLLAKIVKETGADLVYNTGFVFALKKK